MSQLLLHRGGWEATKVDLAAVAVPQETDSYVPVPYGRFVEEVELHVPRFGLTITDARFALARDGLQMFGVLTCTSCVGHTDYALAIGLRNSYDRSLSVGLVAGSRVFCCDNLAFSGEVGMNRKHTVHVFRDLPDLIYKLLTGVTAMRSRIDEEIAAMKRHDLNTEAADHLMIEAVRKSVLPASNLPKVLAAWEHPAHEEFVPRTAWSLFNALSEVQKSRSPRVQLENGLRLSALFRDISAVS